MGDLMRHLRRTVTGGLALAAALGGTAAWAYWSVGGSGAGSAGTGSLQPITVTALVAGDQAGSALLPGGPAAGVVLRVHNPNPFPVRLSDVAAAGPVTTDVAHPGCTTTGVTFIPPTEPDIPVAAGTTQLVDLPAAASMATTSSSACQGARFAIPVTVTARR
jgi:hypothetical protein